MRRGDESVYRNSARFDVEIGEMSLINGDIDKINLDYLSLLFLNFNFVRKKTTKNARADQAVRSPSL